MPINDFIIEELLKIENRFFIVRILITTISYALLTLWLNSIRSTSSLWLVWALIIIQFILYFSIFTASYQRSKVLGVNKATALIFFFTLAIAGRINDWELVVIPLLIVIMTILSIRNKKVSEKILAYINDR